MDVTLALVLPFLAMAAIICSVVGMKFRRRRKEKEGDELDVAEKQTEIKHEPELIFFQTIPDEEHDKIYSDAPEHHERAKIKEGEQASKTGTSISWWVPPRETFGGLLSRRRALHSVIVHTPTVFFAILRNQLRILFF